MLVTLFGIEMLIIPLQWANDQSLMLVTPSARITLKFSQPKNTAEPILETLEGIVTLDRLLRFSKA